MSFNSLSYFLFLPLTALIYYRLPARRQNLWLLAASLVFYLFSSPWLLLVLLGAAVVTFFAAHAISARHDDARTRAFWYGAGALLTVLCFFKYVNFVAPYLDKLFSTGFLREGSVVALPLGISFYTFTAVGYLADVAAGRTRARESFLDTLLFLCFFGTVAAGPILRAEPFFSRIAAPRAFYAGNLTKGLANIGVGLLYKVAVSDLLAVYVNAVYGSLSSYTGLTLFAASVAYTLQLYFDFAGYSLLAIGTGQMLGITLPRNFNAPYFSRSIKEFWSRWHLSLSGWLRDYVYIPLGGNRHGKARKYLNLLLTFFISGLWHGAGLTFVIWGLGHGLAQVAGELFRPVSQRIYRALHLSRTGRVACVWQWLCTMAVVNALWVFFRAPTVTDAIYLLTRQFSDVSVSVFASDLWGILLVSFNPKPLLCAAFAVFFVLALALAVRYDCATRFRTESGDVAGWLLALPAVHRWVLYYLTAGFIFGGYLLNNGYFATAMSFIYNNF